MTPKVVLGTAACRIRGCQGRNYELTHGGLDPALFSRKVKVPFILENLETVSCSIVGNLQVTFVANDGIETLKLPVRFLLFLNLINMISRYILFRKCFVCPLCWLDHCVKKFIVPRLGVDAVISLFVSLEYSDSLHFALPYNVRLNLCWAQR